jgi:TRAP-type C4-dicarboxylate transport system permease small subunit
MNAKTKKFRRATRLLLGSVGAVLLVLFALGTYAVWAINGKYFHDHGWPRFGWGEVFWLIVGIYLLLAGCTGKWRLSGR